MKNKLYILCLLIMLFPLHVMAQKHSTEIQRLATLAKTWGLLKYHNPNIAKGSINWDSVLVAHVAAFRRANTSKELNKAVRTLITTAGPKAAKAVLTPDTSQLFMKNYDVNWTHNNKLFDKRTRQQLHDVIAYRHDTTSTYYVRSGGTGPVFTNEKPYKNMQYPAAEYRLLALFRYWNTIHYFFPYKYITDKDWNQVLEEYIPQFLAAPNAAQYALTAARLVAEINDTHGYFTSPVFEAYLGEYKAPFGYAILDDKLVVDGVQDSVMRVHDILPGDVITHVDGREVKELIKEREQYFSYSNPTGRNYNILPMHLLRGHTDEMEIIFTRDYQSITKKIKRYKQAYGMMSLAQKFLDRPAAKEVSKGIGYIYNLKVTSQEQADSIYAAMADYTAIIYDLRATPDHTFRWHTAHLLPKRTPFTSFAHSNVKLPGSYMWLKSPYAESLTGPESNPAPFKGKVYILVGPYTFSIGEFSAMALRAVPGATVVGSQTAGADGDVTRIVLPGGITTMISGLGIYYPDGGQTQRIGIVPDVEVLETAEDIKSGRDVVLERAVELAKKESL
ncbi:S41 family peptidase [uncultured Pontibacter sp.]|uniref:S41 family peptidase n=1 Tax=uncultured Pontibacter sp. TaxID=453356 RepID=UPI00261B0C9A|nr:S41 family peptidase [uncultured Pontibacter sp.]